MNLTRKWFGLMCVFAFASVISFFQINSYWADQNHFNTGWLIIGIVTGLCAIGCLYKVNKYGGSSKD
jgi:hypothetical protein